MTKTVKNQVTEQIKTAFDYGQNVAIAKDAQDISIHVVADLLAATGDKKSDAAKALQQDYKAGYVAGYLNNRKTETSKERAYLILRMSGAQVSDDKVNEFGRRTELEHKAERAADSSWTVVKRHAFPTVSTNDGTSEKKTSDKSETETETKFVPAASYAELHNRIETLMAMMRTECDSAPKVKGDNAAKLRAWVSAFAGDFKDLPKE